jgi:uncharacterized membrane protein SpoIIM required for sporulation
MISNYWLERRKEHWNRLESLLGTATKDGLRALHRSELRELGLLYRQTATDLSALREDPGGQHYARYLNQLLGRAHNIIYSARKSSPAGILRFYRYDYPAIFRDMIAYTGLAVLLFAAGALLGLVLTVTRPQFMHRVLGPQMVNTIERKQMWTHSVVSMKPLASSGIMTNNMSVAFMAFAAGITAGIGTLYLLFFNGVMLGVIGAACWMAGMSVPLWSFVAPHGVLELPAIFIAGGAGFRLAHAILFPGLTSRRDSLAIGGTQAVRLLVGVIPMLVIAGVIEGFFSPTSIPANMKFLFAVALLTLFVFYLSSSDRRRLSRANSVPLLRDTDSAR